MPPTIVGHAMVSFDEFREELKNPSSSSFEEAIAAGIIRIWTEAIEREIDRRIVPRHAGYYTEYHTLRHSQSVIELMDRPIISILDVMESDTRDWANATPLVADQDYVADKMEGRLERLISGMGNAFVQADDAWWPQGRRLSRRTPSWNVGVRSIRVRYRAGYETTADVPFAPFKDVCRRGAIRRYKEITRGMQGVTSVQDDSGNFTRFGPAVLDKDMIASLNGEYRRQASRTGSRDTHTPST